MGVTHPQWSTYFRIPVRSARCSDERVLTFVSIVAGRDGRAGATVSWVAVADGTAVLGAGGRREEHVQQQRNDHGLENGTRTEPVFFFVEIRLLLTFVPPVNFRRNQFTLVNYVRLDLFGPHPRIWL